MKQLVKTSGAVLLVGSLLFSSTSALAQKNAEDRYVYIGTEIGLSEPVVKSFDYKDVAGRKTAIRLKQSQMYGGRVGYSFYPSMMAEISWTHQPKYTLAYKLPIEDLSSLVPAQAAAIFPNGLAIPSNAGKTNISANVVTLNWLYEFDKQFAEIKPYIILGAGVAQINIKPTATNWKLPAAISAGLGGVTEVPYFKIKKNTINCFAWQIGGGFSRDIGENFSIDVGAKLQVVKDIKIKYDTLVASSFADLAKPEFKAAKPIKKTIGVGEFTIGFTFKIPV